MRVTHKHLLLVVLLLMVVLSLVAFADDDTTHTKRGPNIERLAGELGLSDAQKTSFVEIMTAHIDKRRSMRKERKASRDAHRDELLAALEGVLSAQQLEVMKTRMERHKQARHRRSHQAADESVPQDG